MKLNVLSLIIGAVLLGVVSCGEETKQEAQAPAPSKPASGLAAIVPEGAKLEKIPVDYQFDTAGLPCWADGELYFTNNIFDPRENSKTMKLDTSGNLHIVREDNGVTTCSYNTGRGTFYCCEMVGHRVVEMGKNGKIVRTVASVYGGTRLDGPNDLTIDAKGGIYFTDSHFSPGEDLKQDVPMVLYVTPAGKVVKVIDDINFPNGLELSPDGKTLYVVNTNGADKGRAIYAYDVQADGSANVRLFDTEPSA